MSAPVSVHVLSRLVCPSLLIALAGAIGGSGCGSSSSTPAPSFGTSGVVMGKLDTHCNGVPPIVVNPSSCSAPAPTADAAAPADDGGAAASEFGDTMYNAAGDDDDCKYSVSYTDSPTVKLNQSMTFKLVLKKLADGTPATGAAGPNGESVNIEGFLSTQESHVLPNTTPAMTATETPANSGIYTISRPGAGWCASTSPRTARTTSKTRPTATLPSSSTCPEPRPPRARPIQAGGGTGGFTRMSLHLETKEARRPLGVARRTPGAFEGRKTT
jgi:hypothetical protein